MLELRSIVDRKEYSYNGLAGGMGGATGMGLSFQTSNAASIIDLRGTFNNMSIHGGAGVGGSIDLLNGLGRDGRPITGAGVTLVVQAGASACGGQTYTTVIGGGK